MPTTSLRPCIAFTTILVGLFALGSVRAHDPGEEVILLRGDSNGDEVVDVSDAVHLLTYLFLNGDAPRCTEVVDVNGDGELDIGDPVKLLFGLFVGGDIAPLSHDEEDSCLGRKPELSFQNIYEKILAPSCSSSSCHDRLRARAGLIFETEEDAYLTLVGVEPTNFAAAEAGQLRVDRGRPENSFLLKKLMAPDLGEGNRMPLAAEALSEDRIAAIREWIAAGAPREGTIPGVPGIEDEPPSPPSRLERPPVPENGIQIYLDFQIARGREREIFKLYDPRLTEDHWIIGADFYMKESSHHFILYSWNNRSNLPPPGLREATSTTGVGAGRRTGFGGSQSSFNSNRYPEGYGRFLQKGTLFDLNSHYLNLDGAGTLLGEVYINLFFAPPGTTLKPVRGVLFGPPFSEIFIPPGQTRSVDGSWPSVNGVARTTNVHSVSSHTHRHGIYFEVSLVRKGAPGEVFYQNLDWDDPLELFYDPPLVLERGDRLDFKCTHSNDDTNVPLRFGLTSEDEMCFLTLLISDP